MPCCEFCGKTQEQVGKFQWTVIEDQSSDWIITYVFCSTNHLGEWIDCQGDR